MMLWKAATVVVVYRTEGACVEAERSTKVLQEELYCILRTVLYSQNGIVFS